MAERHVLHGQAKEIAGAQFFGLGGGVPPTPFPWSFDLSEDEAAAKLESCPEGAILVVHSPPKGHVDEAHGRHLGSEAVLAAIERKRPALAVCGHIHQCWGREATIGTTPVVNVGPDGAVLRHLRLRRRRRRGRPAVAPGQPRDQQRQRRDRHERHHRQEPHLAGVGALAERVHEARGARPAR